ESIKEKLPDGNTHAKRNDLKKFDFKSALISYGFETKLVDDWLQVRKNKKATNTETAFKLFINEIEKSAVANSLDINELLRHIVAKSWSGFKSNWDISEILNINNQNINVKNGQYKQTNTALGSVATSEQHRAVSL
ncbi:MAG: hypothetical protein Q4A56_08415, partial [Porphyromonadaceae bacterium]|nr:hypothetical protein [Porphyromonadaceae bacterium]